MRAMATPMRPLLGLVRQRTESRNSHVGPALQRMRKPRRSVTPPVVRAALTPCNSSSRIGEPANAAAVAGQQAPGGDHGEQAGPMAQCLPVGLNCGCIPHGGVHGGSRQQGSPACQNGAAEQGVRQSMGKTSQCGCREGSHHHQLSPLPPGQCAGAGAGRDPIGGPQGCRAGGRDWPRPKG